MAFAPPVSRGNFYYHDGLYVDVGNLNRHKRASVEEIRTILRPDLKKSKNAALNPPKDQVGHWYEAQLIHYGLPPSKDKARAKMRLLEALNSSRLAVPANVAQMEAEMKKEYAAAERKAKAEIKSNMPTRKGESLVVGKKRKQAEPSANSSCGNEHHGTADVGTSQSQAKKAKREQPESTKTKTEKTTSLKPSKKTNESKTKQSSSQGGERERPKQTARSSKLHAAWLKDRTRGPGPINPATGVSYKYPSEMNMGAVEEAARIPPTQQKARREQELELKRERDRKKLSVKEELKPKKETNVKYEPGTSPSSQIRPGPSGNSSRSPNGPSLGLINGIYDLSCQRVENSWDCENLTMTLTLDDTTVWGAYDLGMFSGIIFLPDRPWQATNSPLPFTWRGREKSEGEMSFGERCEGEISFLGNGRIEGWISVYGRCRFEGRRRQEAGTAVRSTRSMRQEWERYNEEAYEEERVGRWGR